MKRICALLLCAAILAFNTALFVGAEAQEEAVSQNAVSYTCRYDAKGRQVIIEGTVNHDFTVAHANYRIGVIAVAPGQNITAAISNPDAEFLAEASMTVKFVFHAAAETEFQRYYRYAIVFTSPDGERLLGAEPRVPSVLSEAEYSAEERTGFKGIANASPSDVGKYGAGTVIIDAELSKMLGDSSDSILYPMNGSYIHVRKSYIEEIDRAVVSAKLGNAEVYFRLLLSSSCEKMAAVIGDGGKYGVPDMYSEEAVIYLSTLLKFISERYEDSISGVIAGSRIDDAEYTNGVGTLSQAQYADMYTLYLTAIGNAFREGENNIDVVIPISSANDFTGESSGRLLNTADLLDDVVYRLENVISGNFRCSVMLETGASPLGISAEGIGEKIKTDVPSNDTELCAENITVLSEYIRALGEKYETAPQSFMYLWTPDEALSGTAFCCAYAYNYVQLLKNGYVSAFAVDFGGDFRGAEKLFKYIDTSNGGELLEELAKYFDDASALSASLPVLRTLIEKNFENALPSGIKGEFQYMDFTSSAVFDCMKAGERCKYIRSDHNAEGTRALRITTSDMGVGDTAECIAVFEYPEYYGYTPYISLCLAVDAPDASDMAVFEVTLTAGRESVSIAAFGAVKNGELNELFFDISEYSALSNATYIKISVRCLTEPTAGLSLWLHGLKGYSDIYTDAELEELITAQRLAERGEDEDVEEGFDYTVIFTVVGVMLAVGAVGIGLIMVLKREEDK